ncbi:2-oxo-4-hydroxy-4-carboxy-5-ureidoimidazoline decarboxylase [soil metagenome]
MNLAEFNAASSADASDVIRPAAAIESWVQGIVDARPFASVADVVAYATEAAAAWTPDDIASALAHHPRIGERAAGADRESTMSRSEQSGVDASDVDVQRRLVAGNHAYEEKFGRVFLIRAAGRSADDILEALEARLDNDPDVEIVVVGQQLKEIAALRLEGILDD